MILTDLRELKDIREKYKITQAEIAEVAGLHVAAVGRLEAGKIDCKMSTFKKINEAIEIIIRSRSTGLILKDENDFKNTAYRAIISECEKVGSSGVYKGNGHHLAQRLVELLYDEFTAYNEFTTKKE